MTTCHNCQYKSIECICGMHSTIYRFCTEHQREKEKEPRCQLCGRSLITGEENKDKPKNRAAFAYEIRDKAIDADTVLFIIKTLVEGKDNDVFRRYTGARLVTELTGWDVQTSVCFVNTLNPIRKGAQDD